MKKSGWIIVPLFIIFLVNALVKKKEFLAPGYSAGDTGTTLVPTTNSSGDITSSIGNTESIFTSTN